MTESLVWLVPGAVLGAGLASPRGGLLVLAACLPLFGSPPGGPYMAALDVAALLAIGCAWRVGRAPRSRLDWPVWAFVGVSAASLVPFAYHPPSWTPRILLRLVAALPGVEVWMHLYSWRALASLGIGVGLFWAVRRAFAGRSVRSLFLSLSIGVAASVLLGLGSRAGLLDLGFYRVKGGPIWESRLHALSFHSGWLAEYLVLSLPLALVALLGLRRYGTPAAVALGALALPTIFLTEQRGAWLTVLAQLALAAALWGSSALRDRRSLRALAMGLVLTLAVAAAGVGVRPDLFSAAAERTRIVFSGEARQAIWRVAVGMTAQRPLLGWGIGGFSPVYHHKVAPPAAGLFDWQTAHNHYLMLTTERGLVGLAAFALILWGLFEALIRARGSEEPESGLWARALLVSFAGFLVYGGVQYMFFLRAIEWLFWVLAGAAAALAGPQGGAPRGGRTARALVVAAALLVAWRAVAIAPLPGGGDRSFGLHQPERNGERTFQWTTGYAVRRLPRPPEETTLELELVNGHPRPEEHRVEVVVRVDGREVLSSAVGAAWEGLSIPLEPSGRDHVLVEIAARPTFRPFSDFRSYPGIRPSTDIRSLGVAVRWN